MPKLKSTNAKKARFGAYQSENRYTKNKEKKLMRHLKEFPADAQAKKALNNIAVYSRKKANSKVPKYHFVTKKTNAGKSFTIKELARPVRVKASAYIDGIPVMASVDKTAMQLALDNA